MKSIDTGRTFAGLRRAALLCLGMSTLTAAATRISAEESIAGTWEIEMDRNDRVTFATVSIVKKDDGSFTGTWGDTELSEITFDGTKLSFVRTLRFGDREFSMDYAGVLEDGRIEGTLSSERGEFPANAVRKKPKSPALGNWNVTFTVGERDITATLAISEGKDGTLAATWTSTAGEHVVSDVRCDDGKLSFARKSTFGERELESTFAGTVEGNTLAGTIEGSFGEIDVEGERAGGALVGTWDLTTTTDRGERTAKLTVFGDLSARYELFGGEIPLASVKLDGDAVSFSFETGFGDEPFTMEFKGKLDGSSLSGEMTSPRGTREVSGKKRAAAPEKESAKEESAEGSAARL